MVNKTDCTPTTVRVVNAYSMSVNHENDQLIVMNSDTVIVITDTAANDRESEAVNDSE
jgi:hypothetical protein